MIITYMINFQEQIKHKQKFNLIKFDSRAMAWRSRLVDCTDRVRGRKLSMNKISVFYIGKKVSFLNVFRMEKPNRDVRLVINKYSPKAK